jgi:hypothetical protein
LEASAYCSEASHKAATVDTEQTAREKYERARGCIVEREKS